MCVCPGDRRTGRSRRRRGAASRQLPRDPADGHRPARQADLEPVPGPRQERRPGPGHLGADRRHRGRPRRAHRRRRRHVHLRGPRRRHAALRAGAAGRAAAEDHHPRRCGHRPRHRVDVVPQRPAARVGAGDGHPHRRRRGGHRIAGASTPTCSAPSPIPTARWATRSGCDRAGAGQAVRRAAHICGSTRCTTWSRRWTASSRPAASTACRSTTSTAWCSAPTRATCASACRPRHRARSATTPASSIYYRSIQHDDGDEARPAHHPRLPVALGHRLVLVLAGVRRAAPADPPVLAAALPAQQLLLEAHRARPALRHRRPAREAQRPAAARAGGAGRRGADRAVRRVPATGSWRTCRSSRSGCARCGCATTSGWPLYPIRPDQTYVNVGFWSSVPVGPDRGRHQPADRAQGQRTRRAQVAVLRRVLLAGGVRRALRRRGLQDREEDATTPTHDSSTSTRRRCNDDDHIQGAAMPTTRTADAGDDGAGSSPSPRSSRSSPAASCR